MALTSTDWTPLLAKAASCMAAEHGSLLDRARCPIRPTVPLTWWDLRCNRDVKSLIAMFLLGMETQGHGEDTAKKFPGS